MPNEEVICPYCGKPAKLVDSKEVYGRSYGMIWLCRCLPELAYVGTHDRTHKPLGRLANKELRELKKKAHAVFDPMWKLGKLTRSEAYAWLSAKLGMELKDCHIGMFGDDECRRTIELCLAERKETAEVVFRDQLWLRALHDTVGLQASETVLARFNDLLRNRDG